MLTCQHLKASLLYLPLLFVGSISLVSCGSDQQVDSKEIATDLNKPKNDRTKEMDERFMVRAADLHFEQILLGKLAYTRASSTEVKNLAKELEEAHRESKSSLGSLGIIKSIPVPAVPSQSAHDAYERLNKKPVEEFDRAYLAIALDGHQTTLNLYEKCTTGNHDPDVKALAVNQLNSMRERIMKVKELDSKLGPLSEAIQ